ncbi:hypothetical protein RRSWK_03077 [Rhodopirellula sp. SWK7]|nr:hypothetical protein RRSWK_03077 [Rhodopirellula sp. SWK7]
MDVCWGVAGLTEKVRTTEKNERFRDRNNDAAKTRSLLSLYASCQKKERLQSQPGGPVGDARPSTRQQFRLRRLAKSPGTASPGAKS